MLYNGDFVDFIPPGSVGQYLSHRPGSQRLHGSWSRAGGIRRIHCNRS